MIKMRFILIVAAVSLIAGCSSINQCKKPQIPYNSNIPEAADYVPVNQVKIKQSLETVSLTKENFSTELLKCVTTMDPDSETICNSTNNFPVKNATTGIGHKSTSRVFMYNDTTGLCLEYSSAKFPIYAADTIQHTVNPTGVPEEVTNEWYKQIAIQIATKGTAKVIYEVGKGNALLATYWNSPKESTSLNYSAEFKKQGTWENLQVDFKFANPDIKGYSLTQRGSRSAKIFPVAK